MFDKNRYMTPAQLAERWAISKQAVYAHKAGTHLLKRIYLGRAVRFLRSEVKAIEVKRERR